MAENSNVQRKKGAKIQRYLAKKISRFQKSNEKIDQKRKERNNVKNQKQKICCSGNKKNKNMKEKTENSKIKVLKI